MVGPGNVLHLELFYISEYLHMQNEVSWDTIGV